MVSVNTNRKEYTMKTSHKVSNKLLVSLTSVLVAGILVLANIPAAAADASKQQEFVDKALATFNNFMADPDMGWFRNNTKEAKGFLIVPSLIKAGFVWGGSGGHCVLLVRDENTGKWSEPAFYSMGSVSWGLQIGAEKAEVILMVRTVRGLESLYKSSFKLGADVDVAAGPVGTGAAAKGITADLLSFARAKGAYAGLSVNGSVIKTSNDWNTAYYGKSVRPVDILVSHEVSNPQSAKLREAVAKAMKGGDIRYHTVRSGDTLWGISRQYRLSVDELVRLNKMDSKAAIYPGMKLMVSR